MDTRSAYFEPHHGITYMSGIHGKILLFYFKIPPVVVDQAIGTLVGVE